MVGTECVDFVEDQRRDITVVAFVQVYAESDERCEAFLVGSYLFYGY